MLYLIISLLLAFSCPNQSNPPANDGTQVSTMDDTGGETGHIPPRPPKPKG
jgi:hypothetical protein